MKNIKENIVYILLGFTFVISIYSTIKISELENDISDLDSDTSINKRDISDLQYNLNQEIDRIYELEDELFTLKQELRLKGIFLLH